MPNLTAVKYALALGPIDSSFSTARSSDAQSRTTSTLASNTRVVEFFRNSGKGATNYRFGRLFLVFDFSSYTSGTITNLVLNYRASNGTTTTGLEKRVAILKFDGMGSGPSFSTFDNSEMFDDVDYGTAYTDVSSTIPEWTDANSDATIAMNSTAISDAQSNGELKIALVQHTNDYSNVDASSDQSYNYKANFQTSGDGFVPFVSFDHVAGYGNRVVGVLPADIANVKGVATANIANVIGVS